MSHPSLHHLDHRPWSLPAAPWKWRQSWVDLAFIHYRADASALRGLLPPGLSLEEFDGSAWLGLVPFRMAGVMRRPLPDLPPFSSFPELNLRTYVKCGGKPGVWFFSLDADSWPIVFGGRRLYGLPYFSAAMTQRPQGNGFAFTSTRRHGEARFVGRYRPVGEPFLAERGTFEHWATERYCLYSRTPRGRLERVEVHHAPWPLQRAEIEIETNSILAAAGLSVFSDEPRYLFSRGVDVVSFAPEVVSPRA